MVMAATKDAQSLAQRSRHLLLLGFAVALVVPTTLSLATLRADRLRFRDQASVVRLSLAHTVAADIDRVIVNAERTAQSAAGLPEVEAAQQNPNPASLVAALAAAQRVFPEVDALGIADLEGRLRGGTPQEAAQWLGLPSDHPSIVLTTPPGRDVAIEMRVPILDRSDRTRIGTLMLSAPLARTIEPLRATEFGKSGNISVRDLSGRVLITPPGAEGPGAPALDRAIWQARREAATTIPASSGRSAYLLSFAVADRLPLVVTVTQDEKEVLGELDLFARLLIGVDILLMLMGGLLVGLSARTHRAYERRVNEMRGALQAVVESSTDAIFLTNLDGRYTLANGAAAALAGVPADQVAGHAPEDFFDAQSVAVFCTHDAQALAAGQAWLGEESICRKGKTLTFSALRAPVRTLSGSVTGMVSVLRDMTAEQEAKKALVDSERRFRHLFELSRGLILVHDLHGTIIDINPAGARALGREAGELIGQRMTTFADPEYAGELDEYLKRVALQGQAAGLLHWIAADGTSCIWSYENRRFAGQGEKEVFLGYAQDVTERERQAGRLREQAMRDPLTQCWNRRYLGVFERDHAPGSPWGCVLADVDHFKQLNDTKGHAFGDWVLQQLGAHMRTFSRTADAVVRMGGDEFLLLVPNVDQEGDLATLAARMGAEVPTDTGASLSLGWALRSGDEPLARTVERADADLYRRRQAHRRSTVNQAR